jgi:hypothetical protein
MNKYYYKSYAAAKAVFIVVMIITFIGCASLEHISELRETQQNFNAIADQQNKAVFSNLVRSPDSAKSAPQEDLSTAVNLQLKGDADDYYQLYVAYQDNALNLAALNKRAGRQLKQDNLYGVSKTLEMMAMWKATYYRLLMEAYRKPRATPQEKDDSLAEIELPKSMLDVKSLISNARNDLKNEVVYPKERLLLVIAEPLLYYDYAYLTTIKAYAEGKLRRRDDTSNPNEEQLNEIKPLALSLAEQMAKAEKKLRDLEESDDEVKEIVQQPQFRYFLALSRFLMLRSATVLIVDQKIDKTCGNEFKGLNFQWTEVDSKKETPVLTKRVQQFYKDAFSADGGSVMRSLVQKMKLSKDDCRKSYIYIYWKPGDQAACQ